MTLLVYDKTCNGYRGLLKLTWIIGTWLYCLFGRAQGRYGAKSWADALNWLISQGDQKGPITEVQFWGHGRPGAVIIGDTTLSLASLMYYRPHILDLQRRMVYNGVFWFRSCSAFAGRNGQRFARAMAKMLERRVAGHTYFIWLWHSGLRVVQRPTEDNPLPIANWDLLEGIGAGTAEMPFRLSKSGPRQPRTIGCWRTQIPWPWLYAGRCTMEDCHD